MRGLLVLVLVGAWGSIAHADPFDVRNPVPDAPPSASETIATTPTFDTLDPGYSRRRLGTLVAASAIVFWGASFAVSYTAAQRFKVDVMFIDEGTNVSKFTDDAHRAAEIGRWWGTGLFAAGAVAIGVGTYLYFSAPNKIRREHVMVAPAIERDAAGFSFSGAF